MAYGAREPTASATLDSPPKGCRQPVTDGDELRNRYLRYGRRRIGKRNIPLGDCQGHAPSGWLFSYLWLGILEQPSRHPLCAALGLSSRSGCSRGAASLFPAKFFRLLLDGWDCRRDRYLYRILTSNAELVVFVWRQLKCYNRVVTGVANEV